MALFDNVEGKWALGQTADTSGNGNTLTAINSPALSDGHSGGTNIAYALLRSSTQYLRADDDPTLSITGDITISAWIRLDTATGIFQMIVSKTNGSGPDYSYDFHVTSAGQLKVRISTDGTTFALQTTASTVLSTATWYHVAFVYDGVDVRIYLDKVLDNTPAAFTGAINDNAVNFHIGIDGNVVNHGVDGDVDDLAVWSRALSAAEITEMFDLGDDFSENKTLTGNIKDWLGATFDCSANNVFMEFFLNSTPGAVPVKTKTVVSADGSWSQDGLNSAAKYRVVYWFEGTFNSEVDIAGTAFLTTAT